MCWDPYGAASWVTVMTGHMFIVVASRKVARLAKPSNMAWDWKVHMYETVTVLTANNWQVIIKWCLVAFCSWDCAYMIPLLWCFACSRSESHPGKWSTSCWSSSAVADTWRTRWASNVGETFTTVMVETLEQPTHETDWTGVMYSRGLDDVFDMLIAIYLWKLFESLSHLCLMYFI